MPVQPDDDVIISERQNGTSTRDIGRLLGRGKNSIAGRINRLKMAGLITETYASPIRRPGAPAPQPRAAVPRPAQAARQPMVALPIIPLTPALSPPPLSGECRYPLWRDDERPDHRYCSRPARPGSAYCPACRAVCYAREPRHWAAA
jgi:hypothetical protein